MQSFHNLMLHNTSLHNTVFHNTVFHNTVFHNTVLQFQQITGIVFPCKKTDPKNDSNRTLIVSIIHWKQFYWVTTCGRVNRISNSVEVQNVNKAFIYITERTFLRKC